MEQSPTPPKPETLFCLEKSPDTQDIEEGTVHQYGQSAPPVDEALESKLRWKMDLRILPIITIIYYRANIGNAKIAGLEADLGMKGYDFNISLSIFYISYILFEIPLNLFCMVTCAVGIISLFTLTDRVETAKWLSAEEKELANARIRSERIGTTELIDKFSTKKMLRGILNPVVIPTAAISFFAFITVHGLSFFLPTIVRTIFPQKSVQTQQLLTVPPNILGTIACMLFCYFSWKLDKPGIFLIICAPFSMVGYSMFLATSNPHVRYAATFLPVCGIFALGAFTNSHVSANVVSDTSRSSALAFNVMLGNIGGLVSTWAFLPFDGPEYRIGNGLNLAAQSSIFIISLCMYFAINKSNKKRSKVNAERELAGKTLSEIQDLEWRHPGFRWHN
ncbi:putative MFS transporter [Fusarium austroafricanum]|uniref:Putative MFS transporter n=1 Tax=Fusarium austroafricanum TaxID=2364996 RepID=A0A8H4K7G0_9HYPO|nr:putative MFS transporter [Fusarium austroafricanum]